MKNLSYCLLAAVLSGSCVSAFAQSAQESCSEMYPADSYEADERNQYIQECIQAYGGYEESSYQEPSYQEPSYVEQSYEEQSYEQPVHEENTQPQEPEYYDGTVEDYVNTLPQDTQAVE